MDGFRFMDRWGGHGAAFLDIHTEKEKLWYCLPWARYLHIRKPCDSRTWKGVQ